MPEIIPVMSQMQNNGIGMIDLVCVNFCEFEKTVADPSVTFENAIEHIDTRNPCSASAAKNNDFVTVVVASADYGRVLMRCVSMTVQLQGLLASSWLEGI